MTNYEKMISSSRIQKTITELAAELAINTSCSDCPARKKCHVIPEITCKETIQEWLNMSA